MLDQRLQKLPHILAPRVRRIVVDREDADGAKAAAADHVRFAGQGAVAVDARVGSGGDNGAIAEKASGGIVDGGVDISAASHAGLLVHLESAFPFVVEKLSEDLFGE